MNLLTLRDCGACREPERASMLALRRIHGIIGKRLTQDLGGTRRQLPRRRVADKGGGRRLATRTGSGFLRKPILDSNQIILWECLPQVRSPGLSLLKTSSGSN